MSDEQVPADESGSAEPEVGELIEEAEQETFGSPWNRRTFLKAAALGTAAAALWQKGPGLRLGPAAAYADDLSGLNCTANDVRIVGPGIILNEPCSCTGTFNAQVRFRIVNNTGTDRYCVTVHFCPGTLPGGGTFDPGNIVVGTIPANFDGFKTVTINNYPCNSGLVCFGAAGSGEDGGFAKGEDCPAGQCCSTITWNVKSSDPCPDTTRQISSKCRHQQVCIQGRGITLDCDPSDSDVDTNCQVACGGTASFKLCGSGGVLPYTFKLKQGSTVLATHTGTATETCYTFTGIGPFSAGATITGEVTDSSTPTPCVKTTTNTLTVAAITTAITVAGGSNCDGVLTFSASAPSGQSGCTRSWTIDGVAAADVDDGTKKVVVNADGTLTYRNLDGVCHTIGVTTNCSGCQGTDSKKVSQCVTTTQNCT